jgi:RNA polymerase sigma-70 factor (ECF subfamily)
MRESAIEIDDLIGRARRGDDEALGRLFEELRASLLAEAEQQLRGRIAARVDAADIVQQTFLEAHRGFDRFLGRNEIQFVSWLRSIMNHNIAGTLRDHTQAAKRDARREQSLNDSQGGGEQLWRKLDVGHSTPSQCAIRTEDCARLAFALGALTEDQREAVRLRHLEGWSLDRIAGRLGRTPAATAGLIKRGIQALRKRLADEQGQVRRPHGGP